MPGNKSDIIVYTDGACSGNPGEAGIGIVMLCGSHRKEISLSIGKATNNIAELTAIKTALENIKKKDRTVIIHTDSEYALGVLTGIYRVRKNKELIESIKELFLQFKAIEIVKVSGHSGVLENERADRLATKAIEQKQDGQESL